MALLAPAEAFSVYAPRVPPLEWFRIRTSVALIKVLVSVKLTIVPAVNAAAFIVIVPQSFDKETPVDFELFCVVLGVNVFFVSSDDIIFAYDVF